MAIEPMCPCGRPRPYANCCQPLHRREATAATAEDLMRSRYAAFALGEVAYLLLTLHPSKRAAHERASLASSVRQHRWTGLHVLETVDGTAKDATGIVAFEASYVAGGEAGVLRERSRFVKQDGAWFYVDGVVEGAPGEAPARKAPCACGSGKKFKRCCGAG